MVGASTGTVVLATIFDPNPLATASDLTATVNWGDGSNTGPAAISLVGANANTSVFQVTGSHTYTAVGDYTVTVTATTVGGATTPAPLTATATVADAPIVATGTSITGVEGNSTGPVVVATFTDANPGATVEQFTDDGGSVSVDWGDSMALESVPASGLSASGSPNGVVFTVTVEHTYAKAGQYPVTVYIDSSGGSTATASGQATIAAAALTPDTATALRAVTGYPLPVGSIIGVFSSSDPSEPASDFTATIDWDDGSATSVGTVVKTLTAGTFDVEGTHAYAVHGTYLPTIVLTQAAGSPLALAAPATAAITVTDPPMGGEANPISAEVGVNTGPVVVATIFNPNPLATASDLSATVDWGDDTGTDPAAVVLAGATPLGTYFDVIASHTYTGVALYTVTVTATTIGGATTTAP